MVEENEKEKTFLPYSFNDFRNPFLFFYFQFSLLINNKTKSKNLTISIKRNTSFATDVCTLEVNWQRLSTVLTKAGSEDFNNNKVMKITRQTVRASSIETFAEKKLVLTTIILREKVTFC